MKKKTELRVFADNAQRKPKIRSVGGNYEFKGGSVSGRVNLGRGSPSFSGRLTKEIGDTTVSLGGAKKPFDSEVMLTINKRFKYGGEVKKTKKYKRSKNGI